MHTYVGQPGFDKSNTVRHLKWSQIMKNDGAIEADRTHPVKVRFPIKSTRAHRLKSRHWITRDFLRMNHGNIRPEELKRLAQDVGHICQIVWLEQIGPV